MTTFELFYLTLEAACLTASICFLRLDGSGAWRFQRWYLITVVMTETSGTIWTYSENTANTWVYNLYMPFIPLALGMLLYRLIHELKPTNRAWLYAWWASVALAYGVESVHSDDFLVYNAYTRLYINIGISIACVYYFILSMRVQRFRSLLTSPGIWWVYATFSYYFGHTAINQLSAYIGETQQQVFGVHLHTVLFIFLLTILYVIWSYAFYLRWRSQRLAATSSSF